MTPKKCCFWHTFAYGLPSEKGGSEKWVFLAIFRPFFLGGGGYPPPGGGPEGGGPPPRGESWGFLEIFETFDWELQKNPIYFGRIGLFWTFLDFLDFFWLFRGYIS